MARPELLLSGHCLHGTHERCPHHSDGADRDDRAEVRTIYRGIGVVALVAALLTTAAARSSGWRRLGPAVGAVLAWSATVWVTALGTWAARVVQVAGRHPDPGAGGAPRSP